MRRAGLLVLLMMLLSMFGCKCGEELEVEGKTLVEWVGLLRHADWATQVEAQDKISRLGPRAVPYLSKMIWAKDPTLRKGVVSTLARIGPDAIKAVPALLKRMKVEKVPAIRAEILFTLAAIDPKAEGVKAEFTKRLRDLAPEVRVAAERGLKKLEAPEPEEVPKGTKPDAAKQPEAKEELVLREQVAKIEKMQGIGFGLVAEVVREKRRAAVVWPAVKEGKILDDDIVAFVFEQTGGEWKLVAGNIGLSAGQGANKLSEALGGADKQKVIRECGVDRDKLPAYLEEKGKAFKEALAAGDADGAVKAYQELTRAFSFRLVAYNDMLPEMLINEAFSESPWKMDTKAKGLVPVEVTVKGKTTKGKARLGTCGGGTVISDLIEEK
jgi:hypothetical protein